MAFERCCRRPVEFDVSRQTNPNSWGHTAAEKTINHTEKQDPIQLIAALLKAAHMQLAHTHTHTQRQAAAS